MAEYISGTNEKTGKTLKKAKGRMLFVDEVYTLLSTSGKVYGKEVIEALMAKMNSNIEGKTKNPIFIFAGQSCEMEYFMLDSEPKSLKTNSKCPAVLYADGTRRNHQQKILLTYEMSYPHAVLDMFVDCFSSLSKEIRAKMNGGLCSPLLDYIQNEPVRRLDLIVTCKTLIASKSKILN